MTSRIPSTAELTGAVLGRRDSRFAADVEARRDVIADAIDGRRVLVVGGAGSIGSSTIRALAPFRPAALHVVDHNENGLTELVRDLRSAAAVDVGTDFRTLPIDFGSPVMQRVLAGDGPYDVVLNFAALKHVRSEKDVPSLLQMLDTNLVKAARLLDWLERHGGAARYFCVSTDKAADPVNLMGASKRAMEHFVFSGEIAPGLDAVRTSARFANVAFSDGSLLDGFRRRLALGQPLAAPEATQRFFVTLEESGHICLLAAVVPEDRQLLVPRLGAADLVDLVDVAQRFLRHFGLEPHVCSSEEEARASLERDLERGRYPLLVTPLDTTGEKPYEEFVAAGETALEIGLSALLAVPHRPADAGLVAQVRAAIEGAIGEPSRPLAKRDIVGWLERLVPEFRHAETGRSLDARM